MQDPHFRPYEEYREYPVETMRARAREFSRDLRRRRSVREFTDRPVPPDVIEDCLRAAVSAPSGANMQPWHFVVVRKPEIKHEIRLAAEAEERKFYEQRAPKEWLDAIAPLGTGPEKPFLDMAPCLIAIFAEVHGISAGGEHVKHYYVKESVGIATGMLITALHHAGLASLTHTPSPMGFLNEILDRPANEKPFLLLVVGYPAPDAEVPDIVKRPFEELVTFL